MNILDFDNTIYDGDTSRDIIIYSLSKYPLRVIFHLISGSFVFILYKLHIKTFKDVKNNLFKFLYKIDNLKEYIDKFCEKYKKNIKSWYLERDKSNDIIISASYELWIRPLCNKVGIYNVIATKTDKNGNIIGENCVSEEKIKRLNKEYPCIKVNEAYGDSIHDIYMLRYAKKGFVVKGNEINKYTNKYKFKKSRI